MKWTLLFLFTIVACGESPLLNHKIEKMGLTHPQIALEGSELNFSKAQYSFSVDWKNGPVMGENSLVLKSWKTNVGTFNGPYIDLPFDLKLVLWMPAMGHGSSPTKVTKTASGEYDVSNIYFIMGGKWELKVQLHKDGKVFDEIVLPYTI